MIQTGSNNTFKYSNRTYSVIASLFTSTSSKDTDVNITLDPCDIEEIVYEGKLNDLVLKGHVIYTDKYAYVDKMFNQHFGYFQLMFALNKKAMDNTVGIGKLDEDNKFVHTFIVTNIKVIARNLSIIKYQIDIVSANWFKCMSNLSYSTYGRGPQPLFDIVKACISLNDLAIDDDSFGKVTTPIALDYITQANDNTFTALKYLMHKLYYFPTKDDSMKFVVYDWFDDKYRLLDMKKKDTSIGSSTTLLSFFKTNNEALIQQEPTNLGSFASPMPKTEVYQNIFQRNMFMYDFNTDQFSNNQTPADQIVNYMNNKIDNVGYQKKYQKMFNVANQPYFNSGSYWNNDYDVYNNSLLAAEENNSLVLNITGEIRRQAGSYLIVVLDRSLNAMTNEQPREIEKIKQKYKAYEGIWMASKVVNIISPQKQTFRQLVALFRNFIPTYKAVP